MRTRNILHCLLGLIVILSASCSKPNNQGSEEKPQLGFSVKIDVSDGLVLPDKTISTPSVTVTLSSEDKAANYTLEYSVDDGPSKAIAGLWDGKTRDLSAAFSEFKEYGRHILSGCAYNIEQPDKKYTFSVPVWMKYNITKISEPIFVSSLQSDITIRDEVKLANGDQGSIIVSFEPRESVLPIRITADSDKEIIHIGTTDVLARNGIVSIPFSMKNLGSAMLKIQTLNGEDSPTWECKILSVDPSEIDPDEGDSLRAKFFITDGQVTSGTIVAVPIVEILINDPLTRDDLYTVTYSIDDSGEYSQINIKPGSNQRLLYGFDNLSYGSHVIDATIVSQTNSQRKVNIKGTIKMRGVDLSSAEAEIVRTNNKVVPYSSTENTFFVGEPLTFRLKLSSSNFTFLNVESVNMSTIYGDVVVKDNIIEFPLRFTQSGKESLIINIDDCGDILSKAFDFNAILPSEPVWKFEILPPGIPLSESFNFHSGNSHYVYFNGKMDYTAPITWTSSDNKIISPSVNEAGAVIFNALNVGEATLTAKTVLDKEYSISYNMTCYEKITVNVSARDNFIYEISLSTDKNKEAPNKEITCLIDVAYQPICQYQKGTQGDSTHENKNFEYAKNEITKEYQSKFSVGKDRKTYTLLDLSKEYEQIASYEELTFTVWERVNGTWRLVNKSFPFTMVMTKLNIKLTINNAGQTDERYITWVILSGSDEKYFGPWYTIENE